MKKSVGIISLIFSFFASLAVSVNPSFSDEAKKPPEETFGDLRQSRFQLLVITQPGSNKEPIGASAF
jgi:hypothetical protein